MRALIKNQAAAHFRMRSYGYGRCVWGGCGEPGKPLFGFGSARFCYPLGPQHDPSKTKSRAIRVLLSMLWPRLGPLFPHKTKQATDRQ